MQAYSEVGFKTQRASRPSVFDFKPKTSESMDFNSDPKRTQEVIFLNQSCLLTNLASQGEKRLNDEKKKHEMTRKVLRQAIGIAN